MLTVILLPLLFALQVGVPREALAHFEAGRIKEAEQQLERAAAAAPQSAEVHYYLGLARFRLGRLHEASASFQTAVKLAPADARAWKALGVVYAAQEDMARAEGPFHKACELNLHEKDACYYLARTYYTRNRFESAIEVYRKALAADANPWRIHNGLGLSLEGLIRNEEAEREFRRAVELYTGKAKPDENPRIDLGAFLFRQGRAEEAAVELRRAAAESPASPRAQFEFGRVLFQTGRLKDAATRLEKCVALSPSHGAAHLLLGKIYYRLGRAADAAKHTAMGEAATQK